jgi:hypothetical protein
MTPGKRNRYLSGLGFTDLLFNTLIGFVFLFVIAFLLIAPPVPTDKKIDPKAEILIILTWPEGSSKDIDMWVRDPTGEIISFRSRDRGLMHLDRDDLGSSNDTITLSDGRQVTSAMNQEIVTIRGFIAGEWTVNIHYYAYRQSGGEASATVNQLTAPITVELIRVNPYKQKGLIRFNLIKPGQEKTAFNFTVIEETYTQRKGGVVSEEKVYYIKDVNTYMTPFIYDHRWQSTYHEDQEGNLIERNQGSHSSPTPGALPDPAGNFGGFGIKEFIHLWGY